MRILLFALALFLIAPAASAQDISPEDVSSPENIVNAAYDAIARAPGEYSDWAKFRALHLPEATLISNVEQMGGEFRVLSPQEFTDWADSVMDVGGENDQGFVEAAVYNEVQQYGDIANVFSHYEKKFHGQTESLGHGINSFNVVRHDGRWWIVSVIWDEDYAAGPIPERYSGN